MTTLVEIVTCQIPQRVIWQEPLFKPFQLREIRPLQIKQPLPSIRDLSYLNGPLELIIQVIALNHSVVIVSLQVV